MSSRPHSPRVIALLAALALCACGRSEAELDAPRRAAPEGVQPVELAPLAAERASDASPRTQRFEIPEGVEPWTMLQGRADLTRGADGTQRLVLTRRGGRRLAIPGPFDPRSFTRLVLELNAPRGARLIAGLERDGEPGLASELVNVAPGQETQRVEISMRGLRAHDRPFARVVLEFPGDDFVALVGGIELVDVPLSAEFESATRAPEPIDVGGDLRHGLALLPGEAVAARVRPAAGAELRFSFGLPARPRLPAGGALTLRMSLRAGSEQVLGEHRIDVASEKLGWQSAALPLADFAGRECELEFVLDAPAGADALCALTEVRVVVPERAPATVLLVTSDTHRADHLGVAGLGVPALTPALDALAARGILFEDCFSSANVTNPSHVALMTGTHPRDTGVFDNKTLLAREAPTLADRFRAAGYRTFASISVRHLGHPTSGIGHGFERAAHPQGELTADESVRTLERWLSESTDEPVFAWLHVFDAHWPYAPPEAELAQHWPPDRDAFDPAAPALDVPPDVLPASLRGLRDLEYPRALYRAEVTALDRALARLLGTERGHAAIVGFTADHGEVLAAHGIYFGHAGLYTDTLHVPLLLAWPGSPRGVRVGAPAQQIDLGRTLLDLAGLEGADFPGRDLVAALDAPSGPGEPRFAIAAGRTAASITADGWHLVLHLRDEEPAGASITYAAHQVELFDLARDPACLADQVDTERERARRMRDRLLAWLADARPRGWVAGVSTDAALAAHLQALGYTDAGEGDALDELDPACDCAWCAKLR